MWLQGRRYHPSRSPVPGEKLEGGGRATEGRISRMGFMLQVSHLGGGRSFAKSSRLIADPRLFVAPTLTKKAASRIARISGTLLLRAFFFCPRALKPCTACYTLLNKERCPAHQHLGSLNPPTCKPSVSLQHPWKKEKPQSQEDFFCSLLHSLVLNLPPFGPTHM